MRSTKAGKDLRAFGLNGRQFVRVEPQEGEDRRRDLGGLDRFGQDLNPDARSADNHQDVTVAGVHTTVLGKLGRSRVDDALLDLAEDGVAICEYSHAVLCNGLGQYEEALAAACGACADPTEMVAHNWGMVELIESAVRTGRTDLAAEALQRLTTKAQACRTHWALGIAARSRALLSTGDTAEREFREAVGHLSRARVRGELARAHLLYGEWLRQDGHRVDARRELALAHEMFTAMGMQGFAERTRRELLATGAVVRQRTADAVEQLTEQEALIARLARDGLSNQEIGAQLFISARTVEWHLRKVFTKLGVSSRRQLQRAMVERGQPVTAR